MKMRFGKYADSDIEKVPEDYLLWLLKTRNESKERIETELARRAALAEGTTRIVATPHVLRGKWANTNLVARDELVESLNEYLGGKPRVLSGCEYFYSDDLIPLVKKGTASPLTGLGRGKAFSRARRIRRSRRCSRSRAIARWRWGC